MIQDLISLGGYSIYNISIANKLGLNAAVYISALINTSAGSNVVDRKLINRITTIPEIEQYVLDKQLSKIGLILIDKKNKDSISVDYQIFTALILDDDKLSKDLPIVTKKKTKTDVMKEELRKYISSTDSQIRDAYTDWIDSVFQKQGWMSKKSVTVAQDVLKNYDLNSVHEILSIATMGGYRDMNWAVEQFENNKNKKKKFNISTEPVNQTSSIGFSSEIF